MKKVNILFYSENEIFPQNGGTERATYILAKFFKSKEFKIYYLIRNYTNSDEDKNNTFYLPNNIDLKSEININFLNNLISDNSIDLFIITIPTPQLFFLLNSIEKRPKVITIIHASINEYLPYFSKMFKFRFHKPKDIFVSVLKGIRMPLLYFLYQKKLKVKFDLINKYSDRIVVLSENYKNDFLRLNKDFSPENIVSIGNINPFSIEKVNFKKTNQVLFVGRLTHLKRVDQILKAWGEIKKQNGSWNLKIIGSGEEEYTLKNFVLKNNINNVSFEGNKDPFYEYEVSSMICLTSIYEGMPMVLLEALQFGIVPIVYNTFGAASDIIKNGYNGFLIEPFDYISLGESISFLINNPKELERMSKNAFESSKRFDVNNIGYKWINMINDIS